MGKRKAKEQEGEIHLINDIIASGRRSRIFYGKDYILYEKFSSSKEAYNCKKQLINTEGEWHSKRYPPVVYDSCAKVFKKTRYKVYIPKEWKE